MHITGGKRSVIRNVLIQITRSIWVTSFLIYLVFIVFLQCLCYYLHPPYQLALVNTFTKKNLLRLYIYTGQYSEYKTTSAVTGMSILRCSTMQPVVNGWTTSPTEHAVNCPQRIFISISERVLRQRQIDLAPLPCIL